MSSRKTAQSPEASLRRLASFLETALGGQKATEAIRAAMAALELEGEDLSDAHEQAVLAWLSKEPGPVGAAARQAQRHLNRVGTLVTGMRPIAGRPTSRRLSEEELVTMLRTVAPETARRLVRGECSLLGFSGQLTLQQAAQVLEGLAQHPGVVGVAARFAKSRLALRPSKDIG